MKMHEIRWGMLIQIAALFGLAELWAEIAGYWGRFPSRPDWFWCLALIAASRSARISAMAAFALCGLVRDLLVGPRLGASLLAFVVVGWPIAAGNDADIFRGWPQRLVLAGFGGMAVACLRLGIETGAATPAILDRLFVLAASQGLLTMAAYFPVVLLLSLPLFRPWREQREYPGHAA
jgi:hypothetical protein